MKRFCLTLLGLVLLLAPTASAQTAPDSASRTRRLALVIGANRGGAERASLRYAVTDAERFASLLTRMGGVLPADSMVLREPTRAALLDALTHLPPLNDQPVEQSQRTSQTPDVQRRTAHYGPPDSRGT